MTFYHEFILHQGIFLLKLWYFLSFVTFIMTHLKIMLRNHDIFQYHDIFQNLNKFLTIELFDYMKYFLKCVSLTNFKICSIFFSKLAFLSEKWTFSTILSLSIWHFSGLDGFWNIFVWFLMVFEIFFLEKWNLKLAKMSFYFDVNEKLMHD